MPSNDTTIRFNADITDLKASMQEAGRLARLANSEFKDASAGLGKWSTSAEGLKAKITQLTKQEQIQKRVLEALQNEYKEVAKSEGENSKGAQELKIKLNEQSAAVKKTQSDIAHYEDSLDKLEKGQKDAGNAARQSGEDAKAGSKGYTVMKAALADLVASGIRQAISGLKTLAREAKQAYEEFDAGYDNVIKATGATGEAAKQLGDSYKNVSKSVRGDFGELGSALGEINTRFGYTGDDLENATVRFQQFAKITGTDATNAVRLVSRAMGDAGIDSSNYSELLDELAVAAQASGIGIDKLTENLAKYGAPMRALGFDTKESIAIFSQWEKAGVNTEIAFSGMKKAISNWAKDGKDSRTEFKKTLDEIQKTPDIASATTKAIEVFGAKAGPDLADAIKNGRFEYSEFLSLIEGSGGAVENTYEQTEDGFDKIKLQIQGVRAEMGAWLGSMLSKYEPQITEFIDAITTKGKALIEWVLQNGNKLIPLLTTIGSVMGAMFVTNKITTFVTGITGMITTLKTAQTATEGVTLATKALALAQMALPWVAIAAGVAAVTAAFVIYKKRQIEAAAAEYKLTDEQQKQIDKTTEATERIKELQKARDESTAAANGEADYLTRLKDEYNGLIDSNGKVKSGYEDRANFIKSTLASALGLEQGEIDKLIGKNGELTASIDKVIEKKRAEAVLSANEEAYKDAVANRDSAIAEYGKNLQVFDEAKKKYQEIHAEYKQVKDTYDAMVAAGDSSASQYYAQNAEIIAQNAEAAKSYKTAAKAVTDSKQNYIDYTTTIQNYENLAAATQDGSSKKIQKALADMNNGFKTSKTATKDVLQQQVKDYEQHYYNLKAAADNGLPNVTQAEVDAAKDMVDQAKNELAKLEPEASEEGKKGGKAYAKSLKGTDKDAKKSGQAVKKQGEKGASGTTQYSKEGASGGKAYAGNIGNASNKKKAHSGGKSLANQGKSGMESVDTSRSGENFGSGFTNSITSAGTLQKAWNAGWKFAQKAWAGLKAGQKEGSPSKLTYKSGIYFTQGYINGIVSQEKQLTTIVKGMVTSVIGELAKMSRFNFDQVGDAASNSFSNSVSAQVDYMISRIQYENESKISEFDKEITSLQNKQKAKSDKLQAASDKKVDKLQAKKDKTKSEAAKKKVQKQIDAEKKRVKKQIKASEANYKKLINTQNNMKESYQSASSSMLSEFQKAVGEYQSAAQKLIDDTIDGITSNYTDRYNDLMSKQDSLIQKLKDSQELFEVSGAGVMTVNDLKEQTKAITDYTNKLQSIKSKVSTELFDEIVTFDMVQGSAFLDRLLAMSARDLDAYNKAYTEKMEAAQKAGETIYKSDFDKVASDYNKEINTAFNNLPSQLEALGTQSMQGFVNGLTKNTDYMNKSIKTFINGMVDTFKKQLGIKSPSKVMMEIGDYTGQGFNIGLRDTLSMVRDTVNDITKSVSVPLADMSADIGNIQTSVTPSVAGGSVANSSVVNNYNLVQNNNSPKALTPLETYQARRQQLALVKAFS